MVVVSVGRKPHEPGVRRDRIAPSQRGFRSITLPGPIIEELEEYMADHGIKTKQAAVAQLLAESANRSSEDLLERLRSSLLDEFDLVHRERIDNIIGKLKVAQE
jgi:hypothetical protein